MASSSVERLHVQQGALAVMRHPRHCVVGKAAHAATTLKRPLQIYVIHTA